MLFMNDYDIHLAKQRARDPIVKKAIRQLEAWIDTVNANSDGWAYWSAAPKAAKKLMELIEANACTEEQYKKALTPIKRLCTKHKLTFPDLDVQQRDAIRKHIAHMEFQCDSQALAVAELLSNVMESYDEDEHEESLAEYLAGCCDCLADWAQGSARTLRELQNGPVTSSGSA